MAQPADSVMTMTVEEFFNFDGPEGKAELVRGEFRLMPYPSLHHAVVVINLLGRLISHIDQHNLGQLFVDGSFELIDLPRTVRAPDIAFVRAARLPAPGIGPRFRAIVPDLAVEVLSPSETASRLEEKLDDYRTVGIPLVWVIDPARRSVMIVGEDAPVRWLREGDMLDGGGVLTSFGMPVADLFKGIANE